MAAASNHSIWTRQRLSLVSLVAVMVFIGVPLWWKTTEVYRSYLPYSDIQKLQNTQVPAIVINVNIVDLSTDDSDWLLTDLHPDNTEIIKQVKLSDRNVSIQCSINHKTYDRSLKDQLRENIVTNSNVVSSSIGHYDVFVVDNNFLNSSILFSSNRYVAVQRSITHQEFTDVLDRVCGTNQIQRLLMEKSLHKSERTRKPVRVRVSPGYQITMTVVSPTPLITLTNSAIEHATKNVLMPFIMNEEISMLARFSISSQVIFYSDVHFKSRYSDTLKSFLVSPKALPSMISSIEAKLGSHVSQWPSLNFIIYIPDESEWPLYIKETRGNVVDAFLVPQWGGVILYNDGHTHNSSRGSLVMDDVMFTVVKQLKLLLGLNEQKANDQHTLVYKWDVDHVLIARAFESVVMATSSLHSLTSLLDDVKNMVISDHIQHEVLTSMKDIEEYHFLSDNHHWYKACMAASSALNHSEAAFFDPSILALLYFPDDQKYAIYIPLFLPISVPVVIGVITALKELKKKRNSHKTAE